MILEIVIGVFFFFLVWKSLGKPINYPPGYWGIPLVGRIPLSVHSFRDKIVKLKERYGDITLWRIGSKLMVFVYDYKLMKDLLSRVEFADRPNSRFMGFYANGQNLGVLSSNGLQWQNSRRLSLRLLRDLGMGKSRIVSAIHKEASILVKDIEGIAGKPTKIKMRVVVAVTNIIWQMIASVRYNSGDERLELLEGLFAQLQIHCVSLLLQDFLPWLILILPNSVKIRLLKLQKMEQLRGELDNFMKKIIRERQSNLHTDDDREDYITLYLNEMKNQQDNEDSTMSIDDLSTCLKDLFVAGTETTSAILTFSLYYLANYPEVQKRLQEEIDKVLPKGTEVTLEDKEKLSYVQAFIHEVQRHVTLAKFGVWREASQDFPVGGYVVPKGAYLLPFLQFMHRDKKYWKSPDDFLPDRFLDENGKVSLPKEGYLPFGSGKRQCLGEALARVELFIFLTTIMQNFSVSPPPGTKSVNVTPNPDNPLFNLPFDEEIFVTLRITNDA